MMPYSKKMSVYCRVVRKEMEQKIVREKEEEVREGEAQIDKYGCGRAIRC